MTSGHIYQLTENYFSQTNFISLFASRPAGGRYIFCIIVIIMFDFVCDRLGSPSDLVKSWGGSVTVACRVPRWGLDLWVTVSYYTCHLGRALSSSLCLQVHTNGGKLGYKYSSGRPHGHLSVLACRENCVIL